MKHLWLIAAGGVVIAPALAQAGDDADVRATVLQALEEKATPPAKAPELPHEASDRAREVQATVAFGQKGQAERAAHEQASKHADEHARHAHPEAGPGNDKGTSAAAAAQGNNADSHSAAARERTEEARKDHPVHPNSGGQGKDRPVR